MTLYVPDHFREHRSERIEELVRDNPFGILVTASADVPEASHLAFTYRPGTPTEPAPVLLGHLASSNPQCAAVRGGARAVVVFSGPNHYVSPRFYRTHPSTPTWNYCAVHMAGRLEPRPESEDADHVLGELTSAFERGFSEPFRYENLPADYTAGRKPGILSFAIHVETVDAQFKMSQNRTVDDRRGVIEGLREIGGDNALAVADIMDELLHRDYQEEVSR
ncbi:FMN-binding negative transcriptional regulator [Streptomyces sp. SRF1]|nr:FMN-binding negative transcriptional regulator [Streptomyces sp. SRF1]